MRQNELEINPLFLVLTSTSGALCGIVVVAYFRGLTSAEFAMAAIGAMCATLSGAAFVLGHRWRTRHTHSYLQQSAHDARHDGLTGLMNRAALFEELDRTIVGAEQAGTVFGVMFLDLDRFKVINDSMGHDAGDELLKIVAGRLRNSVRGSDVVARFGGDEFVIICRDLVSDRSVVTVAEQIMETFTAAVSLQGGKLVISSSIGVAIVRQGDKRSATELVRDADAAMYKAKQNKTGFSVFDDAQRAEVDDRLDIERDLSEALSEDQLVVYYQPLVSVSDRRLYGFEALVRWDHPIRGIVSPDQFLRVAEDAGMMGRIGEMVLREACAQAAVWNYLVPDARKIKMSVNIAEQQLLDDGFPSRVSEILTWSGLDPSQLQIEIIEDLIVDHLDGLSSLRSIAALGVDLAIDDFGTGQSSLSYVKQFDMVSAIKIDKTFVNDMTPASKAIIEAITTMSKALNLRVIAEGVENVTQANELATFGIDLMQGYLFSRPVPADAIDPKTWFGAGAGAGRSGRPRPVSEPLAPVYPKRLAEGCFR